MRIVQPKPEFVPYVKGSKNRVVTIPFVQTSGRPGSPYVYNNCALAAVHSILAGLTCDEKEDVAYWLAEAKRQVDEAVAEIAKPHARVPASTAKRA